MFFNALIRNINTLLDHNSLIFLYFNIVVFLCNPVILFHESEDTILRRVHRLVKTPKEVHSQETLPLVLLPPLADAGPPHVNITEREKGAGAGQINSFYASDVEPAHFTAVTCHCQDLVTWPHRAAREPETQSFRRARMCTGRLYSYRRRENGFGGPTSGLPRSPTILLPYQDLILISAILGAPISGESSHCALDPYPAQAHHSGDPLVPLLPHQFPSQLNHSHQHRTRYYCPIFRNLLLIQLPHQLLSLPLSPFIAKLLRRVVYTCCLWFLSSASLVDPLQSASILTTPQKLILTRSPKISMLLTIISPIYLTQHWTQKVIPSSWKYHLSLTSRTPHSPDL